MIRLLGLAALLAFLSGCALVPPASTPSPKVEPVADPQAAWRDRQAALHYIKAWTVPARMAAEGRGWSGSLWWQQQGEYLDMRVNGPLGVGGVRARGTLSRVEVETGSEKFSTDNPEAVFRERVGWTLPVRGLRWWALGLPDPRAHARTELDSRGRLSRLEQLGWRIDYPEYQSASSVEVPRRMLLTNGEVSVRVVIDSWKF